MKFKLVLIFYILLFLALTIFSYGFVDFNFPLNPPSFLRNLVYGNRSLATMIFISIVTGLFILYALALKNVGQKKLTDREIWQLIFVAVMILFFSWPAFSHDIFSYIGMAKVVFFYRENPYLVMPIEFIGEPMLKFMHSANRLVVYGPVWILLTAIPYFLGGERLILSVFLFKALVILFYLGTAWLIWKISKKNIYSLTFFALNPLVMIESLVSGHNDVMMMFWVLLAINYLFQKKKILSFISLLCSVGIKFVTIALLPFFAFHSRLKKKKLITFSVWAMYSVFFLTPLRSEIYSWYLIWVLPLASLVIQDKFIFGLTFSFSFGLLLRYTSFLYTGSWAGITPLLKTLTTFIPPGLTLLFLMGEAIVKKRFLKNEN